MPSSDEEILEAVIARGDDEVNREIHLHKHPTYCVLLTPTEDYIFFDGENDHPIKREHVYAFGKNEYMVFNHRDKKEHVDMSGWTDDEVQTASRYGSDMMSCAVEMAVGLLIKSKAESNDKSFFSEIFMRGMKRTFTPMPPTLEERHELEREWDKLIMEAFEKYPTLPENMKPASMPNVLTSDLQ